MSTDELRFPFALELEQQHDALRVAVRWFQAEHGQPGRTGERAHALEFLGGFRDQLIQHFRFEELNGFEGGSVSDEPEVQRWTRELVRQHRAFEDQLGTLLERLAEAGSGPGIPAPLMGELVAFFGALRRHDAEENALLLWIARGPADFARNSEKT